VAEANHLVKRGWAVQLPVHTSQYATTTPGISDTRSNSIGDCIQGTDRAS
jgi:hypothetical protein